MTVAALLTATGGAVALAAAPGSSSGPPSTAQQEQGMTVGAPFKDPANADIDAGANHDLTITLDAADTHFSLAGKNVWGESYDGGFVAPTLRFNPGAQLTIHLVNDLKVATNLHFHGMHVSPEDHSDDAFLCAPRAPRSPTRWRSPPTILRARTGTTATRWGRPAPRPAARPRWTTSTPRWPAWRTCPA